jgi:hypothetical protein
VVLDLLVGMVGTGVQAPATAVRAAVAIRRSNMVLIGLVNHQSACHA